MMLNVKTKSNVIIVYKYQELMLLFLQLFYFSHHFYIVWWALLILHAPNFWKWFIGPAVIYLAERIMRLRIVNRARYGETVIQEGITYPSKVSTFFCNFLVITRENHREHESRFRLVFFFLSSTNLEPRGSFRVDLFPG